jgi:hypothetical protein
VENVSEVASAEAPELLSSIRGAARTAERVLEENEADVRAAISDVAELLQAREPLWRGSKTVKGPSVGFFATRRFTRMCANLFASLSDVHGESSGKSDFVGRRTRAVKAERWRAHA